MDRQRHAFCKEPDTVEIILKVHKIGSVKSSGHLTKMLLNITSEHPKIEQTLFIGIKLKESNSIRYIPFCAVEYSFISAKSQ
jgi:hypothetical protein